MNKAISIPAAVFLPAVLIAFTVLEAPARSNPIRWFGAGSEAMALGGPQVSLPAGEGSLLANPAHAVDMPGGVWAGILLSGDRLGIDLDERPPGHDVDSSIYQSSVASASTEGPLDRPLATEDLILRRRDTKDVEDLYLLHLAAASSLGLRNFKLALGVVTPVHPLQSISTHFFDEREQFFSNRLHFARFGEFSGTQLIFLTLAQRVSILSLGFTLVIDTTAVTNSRLYIPEGSVQTYSYINARIESAGRFRCVAGLSVEPFEGFRIGLVLRQPSYLEVKGEGRLQLWNFDQYPEGEREIVQPYRLVVGYAPMELAGGVSYSRGIWGAGVTATWQRWSEYLDLHGEKPDPAFNDVGSVIASGKVAYWNTHTILAGLAFYPTPVPPQTGRTSYVDSHLVLAAIGHKSSFPVGGRTLEVALSFQLWKMIDREVHKDPASIRDEYPDGSTDLRTGEPLPESDGLQTNNPGFPGYTAGGWYFTGGITLGLLL